VADGGGEVADAGKGVADGGKGVADGGGEVTDWENTGWVDANSRIVNRMRMRIQLKGLRYGGFTEEFILGKSSKIL
jgi:hypothetical protein